MSDADACANADADGCAFVLYMNLIDINLSIKYKVSII